MLSLGLRPKPQSRSRGFSSVPSARRLHTNFSLGPLGLALGAATGVWGPTASAEPPPQVAVMHARVYLPGGRPPIDDATVVLSGGAVLTVGAAVALPAGTRTIDAHGKVVTPGFIDAD